MSPDWAAICATDGHVTGPGAHRCFRCSKLCSEIEYEPFPRTPLGLTDALNGGRDLRETMRAGAVSNGPPYRKHSASMGADCQCETCSHQPAPPNSQTCSLCGALHGRWVKTHTARGETKPCRGSWA